MLLSGEKGAVDFIKIYSKSKIYCVEDVLAIMSISLSFFQQSIQPNLSSIRLTNDAAYSLKQICKDKPFNFEDSIYSELNRLASKRLFFVEKQLASFISVYFLIDNKDIDDTMATFLLQFKWFSLKEIKNKKEFNHDKQVYRYIDKPDSPYMKITSKFGNKASLTRYISI